MMSWTICGLILFFLAWVVVRQGAYYRQMFSPEHLAEVYESFAALLAAVQADSEAAPIKVTSAGLALAVSAASAGDKRALHISLSQHERATTSAVANRMGGLLLIALSGNKMDLDPFVTDTRVHHLHFTHTLPMLKLKPFDEVIEAWQAGFPSIPFELRQV
jgi:hypothetical protein